MINWFMVIINLANFNLIQKMKLTTFLKTSGWKFKNIT